MKSAFFPLLMVLAALFLAGCTVNQIEASAVQDRLSETRVTAVDLAGIDDTAVLFERPVQPPEFRIDSWHLRVPQLFHLDLAADAPPCALWIVALDDGGYPIGGAPVDDRYGVTASQIGDDAAPVTHGEHWNSDLGYTVRVFTVDMSEGHAVREDTGEFLNPASADYPYAKPGAPLSTVSLVYPGDVTMEVLFTAPPLTFDDPL